MICCRCGYQRRTDKHFTDELVSYATPSRVAVRLEVLQINKTLKYTGIDAESKIRKHDFGNFIEKQRPLGNYHGMGNFYLLASRVIVYNLVKVAQNRIDAMKFAKGPIQDAESLNSTLNSAASSG